MSRPTRPLGAVTRGTTNPNRLRRFDRWIGHRMGRVLRTHPDPLVVDLGYGASPITTLEMADRLGRVAGRPIPVVGLEIDPERVALAARQARPGVAFRRGGFEVDLPGGRNPVVIRAANVLRQYDEAAVAPAWSAMVARLDPVGLVVEGTCDELGRLAAWVAIPAASGPGGGAVPESLTLSLSLVHVQRPGEVAERLPKALIHHNVPGEPVHALLGALDSAWQRSAAHAVFGPRQRWLAAVARVRADGWPVTGGPARWRLGEITVGWTALAGDGRGPGHR